MTGEDDEIDLEETLPERGPFGWAALGFIYGLVWWLLGLSIGIKLPLGAVIASWVAFGLAAYLHQWRARIKHPELRDDEPTETDDRGPAPAYTADDLEGGWPEGDDGEGS